MLVLTRKQNERIVIAGDIEITVVEVRGGRVKLGIECPKETSVHRREVLNRLAHAECRPLCAAYATAEPSCAN